MSNTEEQLFKLAKQYQEDLLAKERFYNSALELYKSQLEYEKSKLKTELDNALIFQKKELESFFNVKNSQDIETVKSYYEHELESQRNWYEEEIIKRQEQTANWHNNHFNEEVAKLKKGYEEMLQAQKDRYNVDIEILSSQIVEQNRYLEEQLRPFRRLIKWRNKFKKKFPFLNKKEAKPVEQPKVIETANIIEQDEHQPKVSVILPVYNVGKYLRQALDSLINQTLTDIEIICVDDGSTDDSYDILEEYKAKDNRIKVIHKQNKGTGAARNDGLRIATGECIGFVDPDDWVKPNMFERLYNLIKEKDLDIAMCMPDGFDEKNGVNAPFPYFVDANFENIIDDRVFNWRDLSPFQYPMCVWNKLYTKKLFDENNIDFAEGLDFEDHKVIFGTLLTAERMFFIREKLYVYRFNREGSVLTDNNRRLIDHIEIFNIVEKLMKETNTFNILRNDFLTYKIHNLLYYYSMIKDEFKNEYYEQMISSINATSITEDEFKMLNEKYPELYKIIKKI